jgi:anaerobic ribonucleoside-triphosphate reductase activating protein
MQRADSGRRIEIKRLLEHISRIPQKLEGVTISGGEPFDQPEALSELLAGLKKKFPSWNVILYSGYTLPTLRKRGKAVRRALKLLDILIDGPYRQDISPQDALAGSGNQHLRYLTMVGREMKPAVDKLPVNQVNLGIGPGKMKMIIGILEPKARKKINRGLGVKCEVG